MILVPHLDWAIKDEVYVLNLLMAHHDFLLGSYHQTLQLGYDFVHKFISSFVIFFRILEKERKSISIRAKHRKDQFLLDIWRQLLVEVCFGQVFKTEVKSWQHLLLVSAQVSSP